MPKSIGVEDFAAKLALLCKRLNWSRAKLAQEVGVDKSLVRRWLAGNSRPSDNSFMQLNAAASAVLRDLTAADWDLPVDNFARRVGLVAAGIGAKDEAPSRTTISGLRQAAKADLGLPYLGLWGGFYHSLSSWGRPIVCVARFAVDELGLRFSWSAGNVGGEGPALATHSHLHCLMEVRPLHDKLFTFIFNAVRDVHPAVMDGLICGVGTDGTPAAGRMLLLHLRDPMESAPAFEELSTACGRIDEHAAAEALRTSDPFAVVREIAAVDVLRVVCPRTGVARDDRAADRLLRVPAKRSSGMGKLTLDSLPGNAPLRAARSNLRRVLGIEQAPQP
jgi:transcriptional regulator with XRE-family HTH domain